MFPFQIVPGIKVFLESKSSENQSVHRVKGFLGSKFSGDQSVPGVKVLLYQSSPRLKNWGRT